MKGVYRRTGPQGGQEREGKSRWDRRVFLQNTREGPSAARRKDSLHGHQEVEISAIIRALSGRSSLLERSCVTRRAGQVGRLSGDEAKQRPEQQVREQQPRYPHRRVMNALVTKHNLSRWLTRPHPLLIDNTHIWFNFLQVVLLRWLPFMALGSQRERCFCSLRVVSPLPEHVKRGVLCERRPHALIERIHRVGPGGRAR